MKKKVEFIGIIKNVNRFSSWMYSSASHEYLNKAYLVIKDSIDFWIVKDDEKAYKEKVRSGTFVEFLGLRNEILNDPCEDSLWKIIDKEEVDFLPFLKLYEEKYGGIGGVYREPCFENMRLLETYKAMKAFSVYDINIGLATKVFKNEYVMHCGKSGWIVIPTEIPKVIYVMGQSNSGKDTMRKCFSELVKNDFCDFRQKYHMIVSHTNRPMREDEVHRETYIFHMPGDREKLQQDFESDHGDIIALSSFKVANDDYWDYWDCYSDLRRDKINIMIGDNVKCSQLLKQVNAERLQMKVIKLTCPDTILLARATKRSSTEALKNDEMIRRLSADMTAYSEENLKSLGINEYESVDTSGPDAFKNFLLTIDNLSK